MPRSAVRLAEQHLIPAVGSADRDAACSAADDYQRRNKPASRHRDCRAASRDGVGSGLGEATPCRAVRLVQFVPLVVVGERSRAARSRREGGDIGKARYNQVPRFACVNGG